MIGALRGRVIDASEPGKLVIDVQGVGYDVETSLSTFTQVAQHTGDIQLHIHTVVREDALLLYGFYDKSERSFFRALIKVNGVGPRVAIGILSSATPTELIQSITAKDTAFLVRIPGVGKKMAERLLVEMKDSLTQGLPIDMSPMIGISSSSKQQEAVSALMSLGYSTPEIMKVFRQMEVTDKSVEQLIKDALQHLSSYARA